MAAWSLGRPLSARFLAEGFSILVLPLRRFCVRRGRARVLH